MTEIPIRFRPLRWEGPSTPADQRRSRNTFRSGYDNTLAILDYELWQLDATDVVIEADFREQDIRLDGLPKGNARQPQHPGIRLFFGSKHGPLMYGTDAYELWQHNLRAIALALEALRAVDRHGVTRHGEQYTGWKAIANTPAPMTFREARDFLCQHSQPDAVQMARLSSPEPTTREVAAAALYRRAARALHPDAGGDAAASQKLGEAVAVLRRGPDA